MAGKQILGDDPFANDEAGAPPPSLERAAPKGGGDATANKAAKDAALARAASDAAPAGSGEKATAKGGKTSSESGGGRAAGKGSSKAAASQSGGAADVKSGSKAAAPQSDGVADVKSSGKAAAPQADGAADVTSGKASASQSDGAADVKSGKASASQSDGAADVKSSKARPLQSDGVADVTSSSKAAAPQSDGATEAKGAAGEATRTEAVSDVATAAAAGAVATSASDRDSFAAGGQDAAAESGGDARAEAAVGAAASTSDSTTRAGQAMPAESARTADAGANGDSKKSNGGSKSDAAPIETYSTTAEKPRPSEYGPSIDRLPQTGQRHGFVEEVRHIEKSVRDRLLPSRTGEHGGERQRLPLEFVWQRWRKLAMRDRSEVVDEFGRDPNVAARVEPLLDFLYRTYFRVETRGLGHIPDEGRGLIVANHSGTLPYDGAMIMHAVRTEHRAQREVRPLIEDFVFHFPYLGTLMNRIGGVRACPENAERLLQQDQLVAVFPEGIKGIGKLYKERYQLQRFGRGGFIKLALKSDSPIIPTAVVGAEEIHPMLTKVTWLAKSFGIPYIPVTPTFPVLGALGLVPLPTKWFIAFGEPLYFNAEYGPDGANDRILVNKLAEQVRVRIQEMIDGLLKQRKSILFG